MTVSEWDLRQLCADGGCVGVIGSDGVCKVCGRAAPNWGDERTRGLLAPSQDEHEEDDEYEDDEDDAGEDGPGADGEVGPDDAVAGAPTWGGRMLCPDGSCIGVIGLDGRCKVCRKPAAGPVTTGAAAPGEVSVAPEPAPLAELAPPAEPGDPALSPAAHATSTQDRERCADTTCTGRIGTDGRCETCGKGAS